MTKRELSAELNISPSRISQLMKELSLGEVTDYTWKSSSKGQAEIHFTASGIEKIRNRPKRGRPFLEVKKKRTKKVKTGQGLTGTEK